MTLALLAAMWPQWDHYQVFLQTAKDLTARGKPGDFEMAVVAAQMACEIYTEQAFDLILDKKKLTFLKDPVGRLVETYSLTNGKVRKLYVSLTGDRIEDSAFWQKLHEHVTRRNQVVHGGKQVTKTDAEASCSAATELIKHLESVLKNL